MWAVTSLWPQKVVCGSEIYSAIAKLKLLSDQARDLVKNCFEGRPLCFPFKTSTSVYLSFTSGILNKSTVSAKFTCDDDLCGEIESY